MSKLRIQDDHHKNRVHSLFCVLKNCNSIQTAFRCSDANKTSWPFIWCKQDCHKLKAKFSLFQVVCEKTVFFCQPMLCRLQHCVSAAHRNMKHKMLKCEACGRVMLQSTTIHNSELRLHSTQRWCKTATAPHSLWKQLQLLSCWYDAVESHRNNMLRCFVVANKPGIETFHNSQS